MNISSSLICVISISAFVGSLLGTTITLILLLSLLFVMFKDNLGFLGDKLGSDRETNKTSYIFGNFDYKTIVGGVLSYFTLRGPIKISSDDSLKLISKQNKSIANHISSSIKHKQTEMINTHVPYLTQNNPQIYNKFPSIRNNPQIYNNQFSPIQNNPQIYNNQFPPIQNNPQIYNNQLSPIQNNPQIYNNQFTPIQNSYTYLLYKSTIIITPDSESKIGDLRHEDSESKIGDLRHEDSGSS